MRMNDPRAGCEFCERQHQGDFRFRRSMKPFPDDFAVAMAYVPLQTDTAVYDEVKALCQGTLFPALDKPFLRGCRS